MRVAWSGSSNVRLRERLADLSAVHIRMLHTLLGRHEEDVVASGPDGPVIIVAHEISPGLTVQFDRERLAGLVSEEGTRTSHAAILARSMRIPTITGIRDLPSKLDTGDFVHHVPFRIGTPEY